MNKKELFNILEDLLQDCENDLFEYGNIEEEQAKMIYKNVRLFTLKLKEKIEDLEVEQMKMLIDREFLKKIENALNTMIYYANDEVISRGDENYRDFFNDLDKANNISNDLSNLLEEVK